jgi:hypothetical protein
MTSFAIIARMSEELRVSMESPQSGWMSVRLLAGGGRFLAVVRHAPYDSLRDLTETLAALAAGGGGGVVRWNAEPEEYDFVFAAEGAGAGLRVHRYPDHRREEACVSTVFDYAGARRELCLAFWRELQSLRERAETDVFGQNWRRAFPESEFQKLSSSLNITE